MDQDITPEAPDEAAEDERYRVLDAGALRALAHPLRVQIYDILSQYGPQTSSSLAHMTGESSGATSYHLRELAKHQLIREVDGRGTARQRWWERPIGGVTFANPEVMSTPAGRAVTQVVMSEFFTRRHQQLMQYIALGLQTDPENWQEGSMISTATARLTPKQTHDLSLKMQALLDETVEKYRDQQGEDVRPVSMRVDIFPLPEEGF